LPSRCCRYCQQSFQPSKYRPDQIVCSAAVCQRQRCSDYHRQKLAADAEYAQVVRDSQRKWREANADYQRQYRQKNPAVVDQNRQEQQQRDRRRRVQNLVKNNVALDLKRCAAEVWLVGPAAGDLDKNNLALSQFLIFQPVAETQVARAGS
jgi:hypothetical protein